MQQSTRSSLGVTILSAMMSIIRLLRIKPVAREDVHSMVEMEMENFHADDPPPYIALSYTWGAPYDEAPSSYNDSNYGCLAKLNGFELKVRANLYAALWHFRLSLIPMLKEADVLDDDCPSKILIDLDAQPYLWIDAICINQSNLDERAAYLPMMRGIYSKADATIVWLGLDTELSEQMVEQFHSALDPWMSVSKSTEMLKALEALPQSDENSARMMQKDKGSSTSVNEPVPA